MSKYVRVSVPTRGLFSLTRFSNILIIPPCIGLDVSAPTRGLFSLTLYLKQQM